MITRTKYVEGFIFSPCLNYVLLIRKNRPERFKDLLNGIGGHVEPGESNLEAMTRECNEECMIHVPKSNWVPFALYGTTEAEVAFYTVMLKRETMDEFVSLTDELVDIYLWRALSDSELVYNVKWLLQMAVSVTKTGRGPYFIEEANVLF